MCPLSTECSHLLPLGSSLISPGGLLLSFNPMHQPCCSSGILPVRQAKASSLVGISLWKGFHGWKEVLISSLLKEIGSTGLCLQPDIPLGFPGGSAGKESACNVGDLSSTPGLGRSPGEGNDSPVFLPGESDRQRSLAGYIPWGPKESDTTEWLTLSLFLRLWWKS